MSSKLKTKNLKLAVLAGALLLALSFPAEAQQLAKVPRIGFLLATSPGPDPRIEEFRQGLHELAYVEGKNIAIEWRYAEGKEDLVSKLAAELVQLNVEIIVTDGTNVTRAAKNATKTIPIVMIGQGLDPVAEGLVESLARPGGNVTGLTNLGPELAGKRLDLFKEAVPKIVSVAVLYEPANPGSVLQMKEALAAARRLGLTIRPWEVRDADGFEKEFAALSKERPDGLYLVGGPLMTANEKRIAGLALKSRLPSMHGSREYVEAGGLMSYGADRVDIYRRVAYFVDKILKGAKPADLPVEQPTKFELVINLKTAKQIGLIIPPNVLARADRVIK